jgi:hypothetical protein
MNFEKFFFGTHEIVVYIDESGDPTLRDPGNPLFLFGACVVFGGQVQSLIREPWLDLRAQVLGDRNKPLHMRELGRRLSEHQLAHLTEFFHRATFKRVSFAVTAETLFDGEFPKNPVLGLSMEFLFRNVAELMSGETYIDGLSIIFEEGPLAERMKKVWPQRKLNRTDGKGEVSDIPVSWAVAPKSENDPGLEIADFIAHTAAGFTRNGSRAKFESRFQAVFPADKPNLFRSQTLTSATRTADPKPAAGIPIIPPLD